jgi:hypothetical protein
VRGNSGAEPFVFCAKQKGKIAAGRRRRGAKLSDFRTERLEMRDVCDRTGNFMGCEETLGNDSTGSFVKKLSRTIQGGSVA